MTRFALMVDDTILSVVSGTGVDLPTGGRVSPLWDGWTDGTHSLALVVEPDEPDGKRLGSDVELINGVPTATLEDVPPKPKRTIGDFREFMDLFTPSEQVAIVTAAKQDVSLELWLLKAQGGQVPLDHPDTVTGLAALLNAQLITQDAHDAVLAADYNNGKTTRVDAA